MEMVWRELILYMDIKLSDRDAKILPVRLIKDLK